MTAKTFIELQGITIEPHDYLKEQWLDFMQEYARFKCLEAIKNTRHKAVDILMEEYQQASVDYIANQIFNISNQDVMPEL